MFHCGFCYSIFSSARLLEEHEARHRKQYACRVCGQTYPTRFMLFRHAKGAGHYLSKDITHKLPVAARIPYKGKNTKPPGEFGVAPQKGNHERNTMNNERVTALNRLVTTNTREICGMPLASRRGPYRIPVRGATSRGLPVPVPRRSPTPATTTAPDPSTIDLEAGSTSDSDSNTDFAALEKELFGTDSENDQKESGFSHKRK